MDYEKFVEELIDGQVGDLARERFLAELIAALPTYVDGFTYETDDDREQDRRFLSDVAEWLRDNF